MLGRQKFGMNLEYENLFFIIKLKCPIFGSIYTISLALSHQKNRMTNTCLEWYQQFWIKISIALDQKTQ